MAQVATATDSPLVLRVGVDRVDRQIEVRHAAEGPVDVVHAALHPDATESDMVQAGVPPRYLRACRLSVNELLGSFGCNEFMPELAAAGGRNIRAGYWAGRNQPGNPRGRVHRRIARTARGARGRPRLAATSS